MVRKIHFAVKEISGGKESLRDVVEHVGHVIVDASMVGRAVDPVAILGESW